MANTMINSLCEIYDADGNCDICPFSCANSMDDENYADWCFGNNWLDTDHTRSNMGDYSAGIYGCGEDLFDEDWKAWVEQHMKENTCMYRNSDN